MTLQYFMNNFDEATGFAKPGYLEGESISGGMVPNIMVNLVMNDPETGRLRLRSHVPGVSIESLVSGFQAAGAIGNVSLSEIQGYYTEDAPQTTENKPPVATFRNAGIGGTTSSDGVGYIESIPLATRPRAELVGLTMPSTPRGDMGQAQISGLFDVMAIKIGTRLAGIGWIPPAPDQIIRSSY